MFILLWIVAIFLWMYLIPTLIIGLVLFFPIFICITPVFLIFAIIQYYFNRKTLEKIDYTKWFGKIDTIQLTEKCIVAFHPHGILCTGILIGLHFQPNSNTKFAVAPLLIHTPIIGLYCEKLGCIPATELDICNALKTHSVIICPGGVPELVSEKPYTRRHGFLRIAQKMNVSILPVICLTTFFDRIPLPLEDFRIWVAKTFGVPLMLPPLGWCFTWLPKPKPIKLKSFQLFQVKQNIEEERKRYYNLIY